MKCRDVAPPANTALALKVMTLRNRFAEPLVWNGKAFKDLKPAQQATLARENPELYRLMREDHLDPQSAA